MASKKLNENKKLLDKLSKEFNDVESVADLKEDAFLDCTEEMSKEDLEYMALNYKGPINIYEIALENPNFRYATLNTEEIDKAAIPNNAVFGISFLRQKPEQLFKNIFKFMFIIQFIMFVFFGLPAFTYLITYPFALFVKEYTKDDINLFTTKESEDFYKGMNNFLNKLPFWVLFDFFVVITLIFSALGIPVYVRLAGYILYGLLVGFIAKKIYLDQGSDKKRNERRNKYYYDSRNELWVPEELRMEGFQKLYNNIQEKTLKFNMKYNSDEIKDFEKKISKKEDFEKWKEGYDNYIKEKEGGNNE